ncbi:hypothetical protein [Thorsellia anophelis]|uniref:Glycosyl transferase family 2 n=1 Tax=Thorsellia anophelis DSM 18579 TaxID=1123402 RepID=A0A1I0ADF6_9GAMM|nr:hypothetical protein [Thorsellia anophelis]SES92104.1 hypothetical protein SAMN02583745_00900 [Thorsellia anophelis DSM 18579]
MFHALKYKIKYLRNQLLSNLYNKSDEKTRKQFEQLKLDPNKVPVISITFQNPSVTKWQITQIQKHCQDIELLIFDNSKNEDQANEIKQHCITLGIFYYRLPRNKVKHPNRSHALAMNWIYAQFIQLKKPDYFGFIDHDLIPLADFTIKPALQNKPFYGLLYGGGRETWQTWAGYTFFDRRNMENKKIDFMYHFQIALDTGGYNYESLYRPTQLNPKEYANNKIATLELPNREAVNIQVIDNIWFHIGGIGYGDNFANKRNYVEDIMKLTIEHDNLIEEYQVATKTLAANVIFNGQLI